MAFFPTSFLAFTGRSPGGIWRSFIIATVLFGGLLCLPYPAPYTEFLDPVGADPNCPSVQWVWPRDLCPKVATSEQIDYFRCEPRGGLQKDWDIDFRIDVRGDPAALDFHAFGVATTDFRRSRVVDLQSIRQEIDLSCCEPEPTADGQFSIPCRLAGAPYRDYTLLAWCGSAQPDTLLTRAQRIHFYQPSGQNVRLAQLGLFGLWMAIAALISALGYRFRPGGPSFPAPGLPRWVAVVIVSGIGGLASSIPFVFRAQDLGGKNQFLLGNVPTEMLVIIAITTATGLLADLARRVYAFASPERRRLLWIVLALFCISTTIVIFGATRLQFREWDIGNYPYKLRYYVYLCSGLMLLLVTGRPSEWQGVYRKLAGSLPPTVDRAQELFVYGVLMGVVINLIALAAGDWLSVPNVGSSMRGFYKPASAWGLLFSLLPAYFALCVATNLGEERPRWIQELSSALTRFHGHPATVLPRKKAQMARAILRTLVHHHRLEPGLAAARSHLIPIAGESLSVVHQLSSSDTDMEQLAAELGLIPTELRRYTAEITQYFLEIQHTAPRSDWDSPLILVDAVTGLGSCGTIRLRCTIDKTALPGSVDLTVLCNGRPIPHNSALYMQVQSLVVRVTTLLGPDRSGALAFFGHHVAVEFDYPAVSSEQPFSGESYELALALLLVQTATGTLPAIPWTASGRLDPAGEDLLTVGDIPTKVSVVSAMPPRVLVISTHDAGSVANSDTPVVTVDGELKRSDKIRQTLAQHLRRGRVPVLAAPTLSAVLEILYPGMGWGG